MGFRLYFIVFLFLIPGFYANSQQVVVIQGQGLNLFIPTFSDKLELDVLGSPYLNESWMYGSFYAQDSIRFEGLFRYDLYHQEIDFIVEKDTMSISAPFNVDSIRFSGKNFTYSLYLAEKNGPDAIGSAYFEILNRGDFQLLKRNYVLIREKSYSKTYMGGGGDGREYFVHNSSLYFRTDPGSAARKLNRSRKNILSLFGDNKENVAKYIRKNKLNVGSEQDLVKIFNYYNSIDS